MEKMMWERPEMSDIAYGASEYVAACGDGGTTYWFQCNAGQIDYHTARGGVWYDSSTWEECWCGDTHSSAYKDKHKYDVWTEEVTATGTNKTFYAGGNSQFYYYSSCDDEHEVTVGYGESFGSVFFKGFIDDQRTEVNERQEVYIWTDGGSDVHCSSNLSVNSWKITYSG